MKIIVIGGSGLIGKKVVKNLRQQGHEVVAASPSSGVNTVTGEGLAHALAGAQVVVDVANAPSWEDKAVLAFFETSGRNLLAAEAAAGVGHHVALSVVGTDRLLASGYFRAKMAQENLIKAAPIPYTIVRATHLLSADVRRGAGHYEILGETYAKREFFVNGWNPYTRFLDVDKVDMILRRRHQNRPFYRGVQVKYGKLYPVGSNWERGLFDYTSWRFFREDEFEAYLDHSDFFIALILDADIGYQRDIFIFPVRDFVRLVRLAIPEQGAAEGIYFALDS